MNNTKLFLLIGASLSLIPQTINAQCVATQDCATLGYTETSCSGGSGVKCPFGNKWACIKSETDFCDEYGFTLSCTGTNQTGGGGKACNGKYNYCSCADGYVWQNGVCKQSAPDYSDCVIGALYYSDGTCSQDKLSSKTLLGVVIYEKSASQNGWIMTVKPVKTGIAWGVYGTTTSITDKAVSASCTNTQKLVALGSNYAAAITANNYKPTGTPSGKKWCLPSYDLLNNLNNSVNFAKVNAGITTAGGTKLGYGGQPSYSHEYVWSSSEYSSGNAWHFGAATGGSFGMSTSNKNYYGNDSYASVRPVMAF